jgi:hypothetical protein
MSTYSIYTDHIQLDILKELDKIGFKLIPLCKDGVTPNVYNLLTPEERQRSIEESSDDNEHPINYIYNHPEFWTEERIKREAHRFKNVATTYGKTHLKDEDGQDLYLYELDIDDEEIFTRLSVVRVNGKSHYFLDEITKQTYGVRTRKKFGRRYYWLSHIQEKPIRYNDCKIGQKFEIKDDNSTGHGTLPPSRFRNDDTKHYQSIGQNKIAVLDGMYDGLLKLLEDCLLPKKDRMTTIEKRKESLKVDIDIFEEDLEELVNEISNYYHEGSRHLIVYGVSGLFFKKGIRMDSCKVLVERICDNSNDSEKNDRLATISNTYEKGTSGLEIAGSSSVSNTFAAIAGEERAKESMNRIFKILNRYGNPILNQLDRDIRRELTDHTFEVMSYSPTTFVIAHSDKRQILHGRINFHNNDNQVNRGDNRRIGSSTSVLTQSTSIPLLCYDSVIINAVPTRIIKYEDPTNIETKYEIDFITQLGDNFHTDPKSLKDILDELKLRGLVYKVRNAEEALPAILNAFQRDGKVIVKREVETPGFYLVNNNVVANKIEEPPRILTEKILSDCVRTLVKLSNRTKRPEVFGTYITWAIVAPFSFVLKQFDEEGQERWLPWIYTDGQTNTGKTTNGRIVLAIWRKHKDKRIHDIGFSSTDTLPRFGRAISYDTFPVLINEVTLSDERQKQLVEALKHAVQSQTARGRLATRSTAEYISALSPCILTSNHPPPDDPAFLRRVIHIRSSMDDLHTNEEIKEFNKFLSSNIHILGILGDFTIDYLMKNQELLKNHDWKTVGAAVLTEFFKSACTEIPEWVGKFEDSDMQDVYAENEQIIRGFLIRKINETYVRFFNTLKREEKGMDQELSLNKLEDRLRFCYEKEQLIPYIKTRKNHEEILILPDIMKDLKDNRITCVTHFTDLAEMFQTKPVPITKDSKLVRAIRVTRQKFLDFLLPPILS